MDSFGQGNGPKGRIEVEVKLFRTAGLAMRQAGKLLGIPVEELDYT
jgi:hypothetical protein